MKRPDLKAFFQESLSAFKGSGSGRNAFRGGGYAMVITAIVLAIVLLVNVAVSALPTNLTQFDMSASKLYSITSNTKAVVNNLEDDVTIYWIVQADEEDAIIEALLDKYDSLSDHISVEKKIQTCIRRSRSSTPMRMWRTTASSSNAATAAVTSLTRIFM